MQKNINTDVEGSNDNFLCFITDLKSTNKTKIGKTLEDNSLFTLTPQKNYQLNLNDFVIFGQHKFVLSFQNEKGGDTPPLSEFKKEKTEEEEDLDKEIEELLSDENKQEAVQHSENESTKLSEMQKENKKVSISIESEDTHPYLGDCNVEEASPSYFEKISEHDEQEEDSDMDFQEDLIDQEKKERDLDEKIDQLIREQEEEEKMEQLELIKKNQLKTETQEFIIEKKVETKSKQFIQLSENSDDSITEEKPPKKNLIRFENIAEEKMNKTVACEEIEDSDNSKTPEKTLHSPKIKSPFTIPIGSSSPFHSSPQKRSQDKLVSLDESSNTLPLTPIKNLSPPPSNRNNRAVVDLDLSGESATLPLDVSPTGSNKRKQDVGDQKQHDISPKKSKKILFNDSDSDQDTPPFSPLVKIGSPAKKIQQQNLNNSPQKKNTNKNLPEKKNHNFDDQDMLDSGDEDEYQIVSSSNKKVEKSSHEDNIQKNSKKTDSTSHPSSTLNAAQKIEKKDFSFFFPNSNSFDQSSPLDLQVDSSSKQPLQQKKHEDPKSTMKASTDLINFDDRSESLEEDHQIEKSVKEVKNEKENSKKYDDTEDSDEISPKNQNDIGQIFDEIAEGDDNKKNAKNNKQKNIVKKNISEKKNVKKNKDDDEDDSTPPVSPKNNHSSPKKNSPSPKKKQKKHSKKDKNSHQDSFLNFATQRKHNNKDTTYKIMFTGITDKNREEVTI